MRKHFFALMLFLFLFFSALLIGTRETGFSIQNIYSRLPSSTKWNTEPLDPSEQSDLLTILSQEFTYLSTEDYTYVFLSADGSYLLKFFKIRELTPAQWLKFLPVPGLEKYRFQKIHKRLLTHQELFTNYKLAFDSLRKQTGLIYIHLNKNKQTNLKIKLRDQHRKTHFISLDSHEFILQKKPQLFQERLRLLLQNGGEEAAIGAIRSLLREVLSLCKKGFIDKDLTLSNNYGFIGDRVVLSDITKIVQDEGAKEPTRYQREVLRVGQRLKELLDHYFPCLTPYLDEELNQILMLDEFIST